MRRPQARPGVLVDLLVIPTDPLQPVGAAFLVEIHLREQAARSIDPLHCRARALVADNHYFEPGCFQRALKGSINHAVMGRPVMGKNAVGAGIAVITQPIDVRCQRLPFSLVIVDYADFRPDELDNPDCGSVRLGPGPADVPYRINRHKRVR